jgi:hypothetical protein
MVRWRRPILTSPVKGAVKLRFYRKARTRGWRRARNGQHGRRWNRHPTAITKPCCHTTSVQQLEHGRVGGQLAAEIDKFRTRLRASREFHGLHRQLS